MSFDPVHPSLFIGGALTFVAALAYARGGVLLHRRRVVHESRGGWRAFSVWWFAIAVGALATAVAEIAVALDRIGVLAFLVLRLITLAAFCIALAGLMTHVMGLFTGRRGVVYPVSLFYAAYFALLVHDATSRPAVGIGVTRWSVFPVQLGAADPVLTTILLSLVLLPPLFASVAYYTRVFSLDSASQRFRVVLVSLSLFTWSVGAILIAAPVRENHDAFQVGVRLLVIVSALLLFYAHSPPSWLRRRLRESDGVAVVAAKR